MPVSEEVLSYLRVLVWLALIAVLAIGFLSTIRSLLRVRLRQIDAAGFSAKFEEVAKEAEQVAEAGQPPGTSVRHAAVAERDMATVTPKTYNGARSIGEAFRNGKHVIVDLNGVNEEIARRLVDFSAGLVFMGRGAIDRVTNQVLLLTPATFLERDDPGPRDDGGSRVPSKV